MPTRKHDKGESVSTPSIDEVATAARYLDAMQLMYAPFAVTAEMWRIAINGAERVAQDGHIEQVVLEPRLLVRSSTGPAR